MPSPKESIRKYINLLESTLLENEVVTKALKDELEDDEDFKKGEVWQAIVNIAYNHHTGSHDSFLRAIDSKFGELAVLAVMLANYNYQVENGGHQQYFDNGYASSGPGGYGIAHDNLDRHSFLIKLIEKYGLHNTPLGSRVHKIMKNMKIDYNTECPSCYGAGSFENYDEETGETDTENCSTCKGSGLSKFMSIVNSDALDRDYYAINEQWISFLNDWFKNKVKDY